MTQPNTRPRRGVLRYTELTPGWTNCYECSGDGACTVCGGTGKDEGEPCSNCGATGLCIVCGGEGQLPPSKKLLEFIGLFREFFEDHPEFHSLAEARDRRSRGHKAEVVAYLLAGKPMVVSPGGKAQDFFDPTRLSTTRSILTDGRFAWYKQLAYYVDNYDVTLPEYFEDHLEAQGFRMPDVDTRTLTLSRHQD